MPYNECDNCPIHTCEHIEAGYECWIDENPTQDVQDLWNWLSLKYQKEHRQEEGIVGFNLP